MPSLQNLFYGGYDDAVRYIEKRKKSGLKTSVFTPNVEILAGCAKDAEAGRLLRRGDLLLPDGIGVYIAAKLRGYRPRERTNGIDLAEKLMKDHGGEISLFLLGAKPGVAEKAATRLRERHPSLRVVGYHHGYFSKEENESIARMIDNSGADTVFVCLGSPRQERWIVENLPKLKYVSLAIGLGGSLDVWSGNLRRAPSAFRILGIEWLFRICVSPERIKRLPALLSFIPLFFNDKIAPKSSIL